MTGPLALLVLAVMVFVLAAVTFGIVELVAGAQDRGKCAANCSTCAEARRVSADI